MNYYIGIDIGTTSTKAVAFSETGEILSRQTISYPIVHPQPNFSEQRPDEIFEAVVNSVESITSALAPAFPVLISFSAAMHSILAVDKNGRPMSNCIIWADNRAADIAEDLKSRPEGMEYYRLTGVPIHAMSPLCKLLWWKQEDPKLFKSAAMFVGIKEYIFFRLFGKWLADTATASASGLLNIHTLAWDEHILSVIGIDGSRLSSIVPPMHIEYLPDAFPDHRLAAVRKSAFVIGASDGALANLGSGAVAPGSMAVSIGTSSAVRCVSDQVYTDDRMRSFCYHLAGDAYIIGGASNNGAVVIQWLKESLLANTDPYEELMAGASTVDAGCDGLLFIPYILGERAPVWNSGARGIFFGLDINHTRAHMLRSAMEGVIYNVYAIGRILMQEHSIDVIYAAGGFSQNQFWLQMLCDMFNCKVLVTGAVESSAFGAVKIGLDALSIKQDWEPHVTATYLPNAETHRVYLQRFRQFERIYAKLEDEMRQAPAILERVL